MILMMISMIMMIIAMMRNLTSGSFQVMLQYLMKMITVISNLEHKILKHFKILMVVGRICCIRRPKVKRPTD